MPRCKYCDRSVTYPPTCCDALRTDALTKHVADRSTFASDSSYGIDERELKRRSKAKAVRAKADRIARKLNQEQLKLLVQLLESKSVLLTVGRCSYAATKSGDEWLVKALEAGAVQHTVVGGVCSCTSFRVHGACKHAKALKEAGLC